MSLPRLGWVATKSAPARPVEYVIANPGDPARQYLTRRVWANVYLAVCVR
jgi:hypothetical protein